MITRVHAHNYRSIGDVEIELGPLTVLVGLNGSGKSTFVDVLDFLSDAFTRGLDAAVMDRYGIEELRRWCSRGSRNVAIAVEFGGGDDDLSGSYSMEIKSGQKGQYTVKHEQLQARHRDTDFEFEVTRGKVTKDTHTQRVGTEVDVHSLAAPSWPTPAGYLFYRLAARIYSYNIFPNDLRRPQTPGPDTRLATNGWNLASVLRPMVQAQNGAAGAIRSSLAGVVPGLCDVRVRHVGGFLIVQFCHRESGGETHWFNASQESDGTLRMLGVLTALYQQSAPTLIAIEEPELAIHPGMLALLQDVIRETSSERTQVIITTHSPDLISLFDADELRVVEMTKDGTKIGPVDEVQVAAIRANLFAPGGIMRIEGLRRQEQVA